MIWFIFPMGDPLLGASIKGICVILGGSASKSKSWVTQYGMRTARLSHELRDGLDNPIAARFLPYVREVSSFGGTSTDVRSICDSETCLEFNELRSVWNGKTMQCFGSSLYCIPRCLRKAQFSTSGWNSHFPAKINFQIAIYVFRTRYISDCTSHWRNWMRRIMWPSCRSLAPLTCTHMLDIRAEVGGLLFPIKSMPTDGLTRNWL